MNRVLPPEGRAFTGEDDWFNEAGTEMGPVVDPVIEREHQTEQANERRGFASLVLGVKERYTQFKKSLQERTDVSLEHIADTYIEKYEQARDVRTGEVPSSYFSRISRAVDTVRSSVSMSTAMDLAARAALKPLEFSAGMAARYTFADFAIKSIEYAELEKSYNAQGGVKAIERQAMDFANQVRTHFEALGAEADKLPGETGEEREQFRQQKITDGVEHAKQLLAGTHLAPEAQAKILQDLRTHLDVTVYDPSRSTLLRQWEQLGRGYAPAIQHLVTKHIDVYQKRRERNASLFRSVVSLSTFGLESYVVSRALSAKTTVESNYVKALTSLPADQRTLVERMRAFGGAVKEGMTSLVMTDTFRAARAEASKVDAMIDGLVDRDFDVDVIANTLYAKFKPQLEAKGLSQAWLYDKIEDVADMQFGRRERLRDLVKNDIVTLHRQQIKSAVQQAEHLYNSYNVNVTALSIIGNADMAINEVTRVRDGVGTVLEHMSGTQLDSGITTIDQRLFEQLPTEPQTAVVMHAADSILDRFHSQHTPTEIQTATQAPVGADANFAEAIEQPNEVHQAERVHLVEKGDNLWGIAHSRLSEYREATHNPALREDDVIDMIQAANNMGNSTTVYVGRELHLGITTDNQIPTVIEPTPEAMAQAAEQDNENQALQSAKAIDAREQQPDNYLPQFGRHNLDNLPVGEYQLVLGEKNGMQDGSMPTQYEKNVTVTVEVEGMAVVHDPKVGDEPIPLEQYLADHRMPIARVFQLEGAEVPVETTALHPEQWSQRAQALVRYLQDHPESNTKAGEFCAKFVADELNFFAKGLASATGVTLVDRNGEVTGVSVHAPMWRAGMESLGGRAVATMESYFDANLHTPTQRLETGDADYRAAVKEWIHESLVPLRQATLRYDATKIGDIIAANAEIGGDANSHVVMLLGEKDMVVTADHDMSMGAFLAKHQGVTTQDLNERGWMFEELGIEVNGVAVTSTEDWQHMTIHSGDEVTVNDVALNHRYGGDHADTLVSMMVRSGRFTPVSIVEPNAAIMNEALAYTGEGGNFAVDTFHKIHSGDTLSKVFAETELPKSLWMAAVYTLRAEGIDPDHLKPGQLVPIYEADALRENLEQIYATEEARLAKATDNPYIHLVRPGETMHELTSHYFDRSRYSVAEWGRIQAMLADQLPEISQREVAMPGDEYTPAYSITEYSLRASTTVDVSVDALADVDEVITEQRLSERVYLPDSLPIKTIEGVIEQQFPAEIQYLINDTIDRNPEYNESERAALALVFANEGMRETAELNVVSEAVRWVQSHVDTFAHTYVSQEIGLQQAADAIVGVSEYVTSRGMMKDVAWAIHDSPIASRALDIAISYADQEIPHNMATDIMHQVGLPVSTMEHYRDEVVDKLETIKGISSAGVFQVRANNFVAEGDAGRNSTEEVFGKRYSYDELETALRESPTLNTDAAAHILHENAVVLDTYVKAFGDPLADNDSARVMAIANSYNGGPYKTIMGGLQTGLRDVAADMGVNLSLERATGRDTGGTREAFVQIAEQLADQGVISLTNEQIEADAAKLGSNTIAFLQSETMQQFKVAYAQEHGSELTLLPRNERLSDSDVTYANYAHLATSGGALDVITKVSEARRPEFVEWLPTSPLPVRVQGDQIAQRASIQTPTQG